MILVSSDDDDHDEQQQHDGDAADEEADDDDDDGDDDETILLSRLAPRASLTAAEDESEEEGWMSERRAVGRPTRAKKRLRKQHTAQQQPQLRRTAATAATGRGGRRAHSVHLPQQRHSRSRSEERGSAAAAVRPQPLSARRSAGSAGSWSAAFRCEDGRVFPISLLRVSTEGVRHVVFLDGDNWPSFLLSLPSAMDDATLVCCFVGGHTQMRLPNDALLAQQADAASQPPHSSSSSSSSSSSVLSPCARLVVSGRLLVTQCGCTTNAADFAMAVKVGALHLQLPLHVPFTLLSGDKGLDEVLRHTAGRSCTRLNPHQEHVRGEKRQTDELNFALLQSVTQR